MLASTAALREIAGAIRGAAALIDAKFLQAGKRLESSIEILTRLTDSLERLRAELAGEDLRQAMRALSEAGTRVMEIGCGRSGDRTALDRLQLLLDGVARRLGEMGKAVKDVDALAINAKIASANMSVLGMDFGAFAKEIVRTSQIGRQSLEEFGTELRTVLERVKAASSAWQSFELRQQETVNSVPARISKAVDSIAAHNNRAAGTTSAVGERGELIRQQIGSAIIAMQIGDATQQRLEHAGQGLELLLNAMASATGPGAEGVSDGAQSQRLVGSVCPVLSALVSDATAQFEEEMRRIAAALESLAADARALRQLAVSTYGSSERDHRAFVVELEEPLGQALDLFESFGRTQDQANQVITSVSGSTASLSGHLATVRSLEADIRIMGLNATLKCARVGEQGRALGVIAHELRSYAHLFATEADALMGEVASVAASSSALAQDGGGDKVSIATIAQTVTAALSLLRKVGTALEGTLGGLEDDSTRIALLLEETMASVTGRDEIGAALARATAGFGGIAAFGDAPHSELPPGAGQIVAALERSYTMASEREVHRRFFDTTQPSELAERRSEAEALDDALF